MPRETIDITIEGGGRGRDNGKTFKLTEMAALQAERWATRALFALAKAGVDISPELLKGGMASIALIGVQALLRMDFAEAEPLLNEMLGCVEIREAAIVRRLTPNDIEEVPTLLHLRDEVLKLHVGFSVAGVLSMLTSKTPAQP